MTTPRSMVALFPGQGSQSVGMAKVLLEHFPFTRELYEEASDSTRTDILKLCLEGPDDKLQLTSNQQPCILTTSFAWFRVLEKNLDFAPTRGAGHSLGEYSALLSSGALKLGEAASLVTKRGELMQQAVAPGKGKMAAVIGLSDEKVVELCEKASEGKESLVVPANFNSPNQVVIAGHATAVDRAMALGSAGELKARTIIPLNVSAPFHSPLMEGIKAEFEIHLKSIGWATQKFSVASNVDGSFPENRDQVTTLREQIDHPVYWTKCMEGVELAVEMGPGKVLTGLAKRISKSIKCFSLETLEDFKAFETFWRGK